eukprot:5814981-Karenia_brevis.AAC.1
MSSACDAEAEEQKRQSLALVNNRLRVFGRQRVETEALGRCQFLPVQQSGQVAMSIEELRET